MPSPYISNGRLLLQSITDSEWYFVDVEIFESNPFIRPGQTAIEIGQGSFATYVVLLADDGTSYYKLSLNTVSPGVVHYSVDSLATPETPMRLFLRGTDGAYYEIVMTISSEDGQGYMQIISAGGAVLSAIDWPFRAFAPAIPRPERQIIVPLQDIPVT